VAWSTPEWPATCRGRIWEHRNEVQKGFTERY